MKKTEPFYLVAKWAPVFHHVFIECPSARKVLASGSVGSGAPGTLLCPECTDLTRQ